MREQKVDASRKVVYDIIESHDDLLNLNLVRNKELFDNLMCMTKACPKCEENKCTGGYNCRNGAISKKHTVCCYDLIDGDCKYKCSSLHLTDRNMIPYIQQKMTEQSKMIGFKKSLEIENDGKLQFSESYYDRNVRLNISSSSDDSDYAEWIRFNSNMKKNDISLC